MTVAGAEIVSVDAIVVRQFELGADPPLQPTNAKVYSARGGR
jgi:hypothetical protein